MNLWSGSREGNGLAAALTNPTEISRRKGTISRAYPVRFRGRDWPDAEAAYLALRRDDSDGADELMVEIVAAKLSQYPRLGEAIRQRGGVAWLERCQHFTWARSERFRAWEGHGRGSRFLRNLIAAYERWLDAAPPTW